MQRLRVVLDEVMRSAVEVVDRGGVRINAKRVVKRGVHLAKGDRPFTGLSAEAVGRADDLPMLESAAGEQAAGDSRPVVAAALAVHLGRAAKFAPRHDQHFVEQATRTQVRFQRSQRMVHDRHEIAHAREILAVRVKVADAPAHHAHAGLDQPPRLEALRPEVGRVVHHEGQPAAGRGRLRLAGRGGPSSVDRERGDGGPRRGCQTPAWPLPYALQSVCKFSSWR